VCVSVESERAASGVDADTGEDVPSRAGVTAVPPGRRPDTAADTGQFSVSLGELSTTVSFPPVLQHCCSCDRNVVKCVKSCAVYLHQFPCGVSCPPVDK